jgi:radical SAM protein with 4Fe4S-binding SPASM domain
LIKMLRQDDPLYETYPTLYSFVRLRQENGGGFVFNPYLYNEKWVDEFAFRLLTRCDGISTLNKIMDEVVEELGLDREKVTYTLDEYVNDFNQYFVVDWRKRPTFSSSGIKLDSNKLDTSNNYYSAPLSVLWDITYRCNMKCPHCLIDYSKKTEEINLNEVEKVLEKLRKAGVFTINFSGGEPLLREDFTEIIEMASSMGFGLRISTNGLLLDEDTIRSFIDNMLFCVQVSVDGMRETHDSFRGLEGSFKKAIQALRISSDNGLHTTMSTMIIKPNINEIPDLLDLAVINGFSSFKLNSFMPVGRGSSALELGVTKDQVKRLASVLLEKRDLYKDKIDVQMDAVFPWLYDDYGIGEMTVRGIRGQKRVRCSAGQTNLVISPDGTVYPCPYLTDFPLGNILKDPLEAIWHDNFGILGKFRNIFQNDLKGKCSDCKFIPSNCNGGCRAAAYNITGDLFAEDPFCWK